MQQGDVFTDILSLWELYLGYGTLFQLEIQTGNLQRNCTVIMFRYMYPVETSAEPIFRLRLATFQRRSNDANHLSSSIFIFPPMFNAFHQVSLGVQKSTRFRKPHCDSGARQKLFSGSPDSKPERGQVEAELEVLKVEVKVKEAQ